MFKTGFIKIKTQILETIFAELPPTAKKVKMTIKFEDEEKLNTFKRLEAERRELEDDNQSINTQSDSEDDSDQEAQNIKEGPKSKGKPQNQEMKKPATNKLRTQIIKIGLEQGIIYKQYYEKQFKRIGQCFKVNINVRAQKITFEGYEIEDIEEAMVQVDELRKQVEIQYIPKYGLEISESEMIRKKLEKYGVKIFRILDKYYRWFEISPRLSQDLQKERRKDIKNVLSEIDKSNHCLQYLYSIQEDIDSFKGSLTNDLLKLRMKFLNYKPLLEQLKGKIFLNELMYKINGETNEDQLEAELSLSKDAIVFHAIAKELLQMTIKQVRVQFQSYQYFYITIDSDQQIQKAIELLKTYEYQSIMQASKNKSVVGQFQEIKDINYIHFSTNYDQVKESIQQKINDSSFYGDQIPRQNVIFCIGFRKKYPEYKLDYISEIMTKLVGIWNGASFKFSIFLDQEQQIQDNKVSYEFSPSQKLFSVSANENSLQTNIFILKNYIIKKKLQSIRNKQFNLSQDSTNVSISTINQSSIIQGESVIFNQKSMTQDMNTSSILQGANIENYQLAHDAQSQLKNQDGKLLQALKEYSVFLAETNKEYNQKYKDTDVKINQIVPTDKRNRSLEQQLSSFSDSRFQVLKIKLNQLHKVDSFYEDPKRDQIVTVFVASRISPFIKPKEIGLKIQQGMNEFFPIRLLTKQPITENGALLNIKKKNIQIQGKNFKVKYGSQFEVAKSVIYLKKV